MAVFTIICIAAIIFSSTPASAQKNLPTVRIGIEAPAGTNAHYYVTKQLGLFQKHGINIELISFPGGTVGLQALLAGDIQFASEDGVAGLSANLRGANLYFIAGMINTFPFSILSRAEIRTPQELRGKKIVISRYGSSSDTAVRVAVEKYGLKPDKDVIILQGGGQSERFAALRAGAIDAAIVSPPLNLTGKRLGFNEVIDLSQSGVPYSHQQIVAIKDYLERNPDTALRTLRALIEGLAAWKDPGKKAAVMTFIAKYLRLDSEKNKDQIEETYRYYSNTFPIKPYATAEGLEFTAQILKKNRPEAKDIQAKDWLNNRFVAELEKEGFLAKVFGGK
jgi:ABC-type nitrate/sulfonate/bicarbonate transport system substrate-binding protein